jgi:hypothetical protein
MSAISDIDICYSDIGDKNVGLKTVIPILEVFRYRHQSPFQYPTLKKKLFLQSWVQIQQSPQPTVDCQSLDGLPSGMALCCRLSSEGRQRSIYKKHQKQLRKIISPGGFKPVPLEKVRKLYTTQLQCLSNEAGMSDIRYRIKLYSDIWYNVGLRSFSPISERFLSGSVRCRWSRISD